MCPVFVSLPVWGLSHFVVCSSCVRHVSSSLVKFLYFCHFSISSFMLGCGFQISFTWSLCMFSRNWNGLPRPWLNPPVCNHLHLPRVFKPRVPRVAVQSVPLIALVHMVNLPGACFVLPVGFSVANVWTRLLCKFTFGHLSHGSITRCPSARAWLN